MSELAIQPAARAKAFFVSHPAEQGRDAKRAKLCDVDLTVPNTPVADSHGLPIVDLRVPQTPWPASSASSGSHGPPILDLTVPPTPAKASVASHGRPDLDDAARQVMFDDMEFGHWLDQGLAADEALAKELEALFDPPEEGGTTPEAEPNANKEQNIGSKKVVAKKTKEPVAKLEPPLQPVLDDTEANANKEQNIGSKKVVAKKTKEPVAKPEPPLQPGLVDKEANANKEQKIGGKKVGATKTKEPVAKQRNVSAEFGRSNVFAKYMRLSALLRAKPELFDTATPDQIATWGDWYGEHKQVLSELPRSAHPKPLCNRGNKSYTLVLKGSRVSVRLDSGTFHVKDAEAWTAEWGFDLNKDGGLSIAWRKHGVFLAWTLVRLFAGELDGLAPQYPASIR
jgi:hypothetical protein